MWQEAAARANPSSPCHTHDVPHSVPAYRSNSRDGTTTRARAFVGWCDVGATPRVSPPRIAPPCAPDRCARRFASPRPADLCVSGAARMRMCVAPRVCPCACVGAWRICLGLSVWRGWAPGARLGDLWRRSGGCGSLRQAHTAAGQPAPACACARRPQTRLVCWPRLPPARGARPADLKPPSLCGEPFGQLHAAGLIFPFKRPEPWSLSGYPTVTSQAATGHAPLLPLALAPAHGAGSGCPSPAWACACRGEGPLWVSRGGRAPCHHLPEQTASQSRRATQPRGRTERASNRRRPSLVFEHRTSILSNTPCSHSR